jgi:hypothetical protein
MQFMDILQLVCLENAIHIQNFAKFQERYQNICAGFLILQEITRTKQNQLEDYY